MLYVLYARRVRSDPRVLTSKASDPPVIDRLRHLTIFLKISYLSISLYLYHASISTSSVSEHTTQIMIPPEGAVMIAIH